MKFSDESFENEFIEKFQISRFGRDYNWADERNQEFWIIFHPSVFASFVHVVHPATCLEVYLRLPLLSLLSSDKSTVLKRLSLARSYSPISSHHFAKRSNYRVSSIKKYRVESIGLFLDQLFDRHEILFSLSLSPIHEFGWKNFVFGKNDYFSSIFMHFFPSLNLILILGNEKKTRGEKQPSFPFPFLFFIKSI